MVSISLEMVYASTWEEKNSLVLWFFSKYFHLIHPFMFLCPLYLVISSLTLCLWWERQGMHSVIMLEKNVENSFDSWFAILSPGCSFFGS